MVKGLARLLPMDGLLEAAIDLQSVLSHVVGAWCDIVADTREIVVGTMSRTLVSVNYSGCI